MKKDLRTQFIDYMTLQRFSPHTKRNYLNALKGLTKFYKQSPDTLTNEELQEYFRYLFEDRKVSWGTCNIHLSALRVFYLNVCKWEETRVKIPPRPRIKKLSVVLSLEEMRRLLASAKNLKDLVLLEATYSAGLRVSEVVCLNPQHIESDPSRMMIRVVQGKGKKDRYTVLSKKFLEHLRVYWQRYRPKNWLFPGQKPGTHISEAMARRAYYYAKKKPV